MRGGGSVFMVKLGLGEFGLSMGGKGFRKPFRDEALKRKGASCWLGVKGFRVLAFEGSRV